MPPRSRGVFANLNSASSPINSLQQHISSLLCIFCTHFLHLRQLSIALLCLWLTLFSSFILHWSSLRAATPGSTTAFYLHPEPSHLPTCTSLAFALSQSSHWMQSSYLHPSLAAAMMSCVPSAGGGELQRLGMRISRSGIDFSSSLSSAPVTPSDAQLFYTLLGASFSRSSACSDLLRDVDKQGASSMIFLIRQPIPSLSIVLSSLFFSPFYPAPTITPLFCPAPPPPHHPPCPASTARKSP